MPLSRRPAQLEEKTIAFLKTDDAIRSLVHQLVDTFGQEGQDWLATNVLGAKAATEAQGNIDFANQIGARQLSPTERKTLELASLINFFEYRKKLLSKSIPATTVAEMLGVSRQTVHDRTKQGHLLGVLDNNILKFPEWQFDPEGPNGIVPGLPEVLASLSCNEFAKISWLSSTSSVFAGLRIIDALKNGQITEVIHEAQSIGVA